MQIENQSRSKDRESRSRRNLSSIDVGFGHAPALVPLNFCQAHASLWAECTRNLLGSRSRKLFILPHVSAKQRVVSIDVQNSFSVEKLLKHSCWHFGSDGGWTFIPRERSDSISLQVNRESSSQSFHAMHSMAFRLPNGKRHFIATAFLTVDRSKPQIKPQPPAQYKLLLEKVENKGEEKTFHNEKFSERVGVGAEFNRV